MRPERGMLHDWPCQVVWGGVNGQLEQGVRVACVFFRNELPFLVKSLDLKLFVGVSMFGLLRGLSRVIMLFIVPYSCWLHRMCCAYADFGLLYLIYLICSF